LETTVFNWYFDDRPEREYVRTLFEEIRQGKHEGYTSIYVEAELSQAPDPKMSGMFQLIADCGIKVLPTGSAADTLAETYVAGGIIPADYLLDATHIACAAVYGLDYIVSYNFKHINRIRTKLQTGRVNAALGYGNVVICTAKEVLDDDGQD
jgi:predicted nucleic acid-binding protein